MWIGLLQSTFRENTEFSRRNGSVARNATEFLACWPALQISDLSAHTHTHRHTHPAVTQGRERKRGRERERDIAFLQQEEYGQA